MFFNVDNDIKENAVELIIDTINIRHTDSSEKDANIKQIYDM